ncbi:MAG: hypothetical protein V3V15_05230 [Sphingorhabdus sp.]
MTKFSKLVCDKLGAYVYRLIDPRNGETFYVGKGLGNRVFDHALGENISDEEVDGSTRLSRIREIMLAGFSVQHVIHRHGLDNKTAMQVEAALIDAYPGLTNVITGKGSRSVGAMHADQVKALYEAKELELQHNVVMITINRSSADDSVYEAVRYAWKLNHKRAEKACYVLAVVHGLVVGVFVAKEWLPATPENFEGRETRESRFGFRGSEASEDIQKLYLRKRVPASFRKRGASNPVKYGKAD